jgi:DNA-binding transcriptional LysR family regulator
MMDWDDVRFFLEVARHGNLSGGARALGVNHSTVSRRIKAIEEQQGVRLFDRVQSGYTLTEDAAELYELALEIEALNFSFSRKLQGQDTALSGRVTITMPHDIFEFFFAKRLAEFQTQHPEISLDVFVAKGTKNLFAREADIAIRLTDKPPEYLVGKKICNLHYGIFYSANLPRNESSTPIITWSGEDEAPEWAINQLNNPEIKLQVDDLYAMYQAVEAGFGYARMPLYIHNFCGSQSINKLPVDLPPSSWGVWALSHADLRKISRVQVCKQFMQEQLESKVNQFTK